MAGPRAHVEVNLKGPFFDSDPSLIVNRFLPELVDDVARDALSEWHMGLDVHIRNPTPYYETQLNVETRSREASVNDRGVVYGPWLEGTGSRNATTRFKGYAQARAATERVQRRIPSIVAGTVRRLVEALQ